MAGLDTLKDKLDREWLETDGLGGFSSGTATGIRTRRYHALLLTATTPPSGRIVLVNGFEAWVETPRGRFALSSHMYAPGMIHPGGYERIRSFSVEPWPHWTYHLEDGTEIEYSLFIPHGQSAAALSWRLLSPRSDVALHLRPLLSGRDYHALHHENPALRFAAEIEGPCVLWRTYDGLPGIEALSNGGYHHDPLWYRRFLYAKEKDRGLDFEEDLASPGVFRFDLSAGPAVMMLSATSAAHPSASSPAPEAAYEKMRAGEEKRRASFPSSIHRAADAYIVRRKTGKTIIAGYPWFTDWGRDTFIALRGLCLSTGRLDLAGDILLQWAAAVSEGMLPNLFPDGDAPPEYNSVDASLWYVLVVDEYLQARERRGERIPAGERSSLRRAVESILTGYNQGTRYGIGADEDGLLKAGTSGAQLTWMDAKVGDWVVTPRAGKPVEVQALWINALRVGSRGSDKWGKLAEKAETSFREKFWNARRGILYDVVDARDLVDGIDPSFRPNQILAVGGLPHRLVDDETARQVVSAVEQYLWTPLGLRSLAPGEAGYVSRYNGGVRERDGAYHQGTVWPWLLGPFVEAWLRVRGGGTAARYEAHERFLKPLWAHLDEGGLGHVSEIADGEPDHIPRGCPFQAWSLGELLRIEALLRPLDKAGFPQKETGRKRSVHRERA